MFFLVAAIACSEVSAQHARPHGLLDDYYPAFCHPALYPSPSCRLVVFRENKRQASVVVPLRLELFAYAAEGGAIYSLSVLKPPACLYRIELNPVGVMPLTCPPGLAAAFNFAVSRSGDRLLLSGQFRDGGGSRCGVFEIRLPGGTAARQVLDAEDCGSYKFGNSWRSLSLAPDGGRAVAVRRNELELIQVALGTSSKIAEGILKAAWSPDGRWIAALGVHGGTELIDTTDFRSRRALADSEVQWSPDSRYLLRIKKCLFPIATNGVGTVQALEVATGNSVTIESSRCAVEDDSTGWVSAAVAH
jgi:hypothetical protein